MTMAQIMPEFLEDFSLNHDVTEPLVTANTLLHCVLLASTQSVKALKENTKKDMKLVSGISPNCVNLINSNRSPLSYTQESLSYTHHITKSVPYRWASSISVLEHHKRL